MIDHPPAMEVLWNQTPRKRWERLTADAAWQQHWGYGGAVARLGSAVLRAEVRDAGETVALAQFTGRAFLRRLHVAACTRGPVWTGGVDAGLRAAVYRSLRRTAPVPWPRGVFFTPDSAEDAGPGGAGLRRVMSACTTATIDLTRSMDALLAAMDGKWRNRLRAAERSGMEIAAVRARPGSYDWLLAEELAQRRGRRYRALPPAMLAAWQAADGRLGALRLFTARLGAEAVAAMLFVMHGNGALYHVGWSSAAGRALNAHNLLLWRAMRKLRGLGLRRLDLGLIDTEDSAGVARFKLGSGAAVRRLCGTWY